MGNVVGSNIFNALGILGLSALVRPLPVGPQVLILDAPVMIAVSVACLPVMLSGRRIERWEGAVFALCYGFYSAALIGLAGGAIGAWAAGWIAPVIVGTLALATLVTIWRGRRPDLDFPGKTG